MCQIEGVTATITREGSAIKADIVHTTRVHVLGIDLAKNSFSLHGVNAHGKCVLSKSLSRAKLAVFVAQLPPFLVGMEACSGAHHRARVFTGMGTPCASWRSALLPRQFTTGGVVRWGRITKQCDTYWRMLLIHGTRAALAQIKDKHDTPEPKREHHEQQLTAHSRQKLFSHRVTAEAIDDTQGTDPNDELCLTQWP